MYTNFKSLREEARAHILETLEDYEGYTCDFHNEAFNTDYYEYYTSNAIDKLEELGVFDAIQTVKEYEQDNFGAVNLICFGISLVRKNFVPCLKVVKNGTNSGMKKSERRKPKC